MFRRKSLLIIVSIICFSFLYFFSCEKTKESIPGVYQQPNLKEYSLKEISFIKSITDMITEEELREYVLTLQNFGTRYAPSQGNLKAAHYLKQTFQSFGIEDVKFDEFSYYNGLTGMYDTTRNVVASKPGVSSPEKIVIIGAHFDTICRRAPDGRVSALDKENPAPGSDDNGTGDATILAAARILNSYEFDHTIRFVAFSAEEGGLHGSSHYAAEAAKKGEDIIAMINIDMIGYKDQEPEDIDIFANEKSTWLLDTLVNNAAVYAPGLLIYRIVNDTYDGSDHAPFWNNGYPAVCFMEDYYPSNRLYHAPTDTVDTINFPFLLNNVRLAVGSLAELAGIRLDGKEPIRSDLSKKYQNLKALDWQKDSGNKFLFTFTPFLNQADIIDISLPNIHSKQNVILEHVPPETYGVPQYYPVAVCQKPVSKQVYISMIKQRAPGKESEEGIVKIVDVKKGKIVSSFKVGKYPTAGCFNADGTKFFQPYWGEKFIDIFNTTSLKRISQISTPLPISKLAVDEMEKRAIGISPENNSIVIISLYDKRIEKVIENISIPIDVIMMSSKFALVCSYGQEKIYQIDMDEKNIIEAINISPRPMHLIISPHKDMIVSIHQLSSKINLFHIREKNGELAIEKDKELDMGEVITNGTCDDNNNIYFISSSKYRLFGFNLSRGEVFWGIRTGGVRAWGGVENIIFIRK